MIKQVDSIVVGAGAGGLAMALLLAQTGRKIIVIEKSPKVGGALGSFQNSGFNLDAGFHFTGGLQENGIFYHILQLFGIRELITPEFLDPAAANIFHFSESDRSIEFPYGLKRIITKLKSEFPGENNAIDAYFKKVQGICEHTPTLHIQTLDQIPAPVQEDYVTLQDYLHGITDNKLLKEVLSTLIMCHGSAPTEISMANHARLCQGFYENICQISGGGTSLVNAFMQQLKNYDVEIITSDEITSITDIKNKKAGRFILSSGTEIKSDMCVFTISPASILDILPKEHFPPAFSHRVQSFEYSPGFFTVFASLDSETTLKNPKSITSLYPVNDINALSLPGWKGPGALAMMHSKSGKSNILTSFEPIYWSQVQQWENSITGSRPKDYLRWKEEKTNEILNRITDHFTEYKGHIKLITSSTPLTYRDYLFHHQGAAYGIKQKINQFNLLGQLRIKNLFVAGQSAILPGVLGTIMASVLVGRNIIGKDEFRNYLQSNI